MNENISDSNINAPTSNSARNRHRDRKMSKQQSSLETRTVDKSDSTNSGANQPISDDNSQPRTSLTMKPANPQAVGSLEDVIGESHYVSNEHLKLDQITPYSSNTAKVSHNLHQIKARNSLLVKNELSVIKNQLKLTSDTSKMTALVASGQAIMPPVSSTVAEMKSHLRQAYSPTTRPESERPNIIASLLSPPEELAQILQKDNYAVMKMLERLPLSATKPDTPNQIHSILSPIAYVECLVAMSTWVIEETTQVSTLFRDNRLTNKMLDCFMNLEASSYLTSTLKPVLKSVLNSAEPFEIDPRYLEEEEDLSENITHLMEMVEQITSSIYNSSSRMPRNLQYVFYKMRQTVLAKFPNDFNAPFTTISAFVILRFFNPTLIKASMENMDDLEKNTRKFVLISKIIQKLANFQLFQKEQHMICFNNFIEVNIPKMRNYLLEISTQISEPTSTTISISPDYTSCYTLADTIASSLGALYTLKKDTTLLDELASVLKKLRTHAPSPLMITPNIGSLEKGSPISYVSRPISALQKQNLPGQSQSLSALEKASSEQYINTGSIQIEENNNGNDGQTPILNEGSSNSIVKSDARKSLERDFSLPPPAVVISDVSFKSEAAHPSQVAIDVYPQRSLPLKSQLVPVEQNGWRKRRTRWANVLIIILVLIILGAGVGLSYWKLYMGQL